jgi:hypothetical protein
MGGAGLQELHLVPGLNDINQSSSTEQKGWGQKIAPTIFPMMEKLPYRFRAGRPALWCDRCREPLTPGDPFTRKRDWRQHGSFAVEHFPQCPMPSKTDAQYTHSTVQVID